MAVLADTLLNYLKPASVNKQPANHINGLLLVDKEQDWTSHDVVNFVRRRFNLSKCGHCGTLDPFATGLLVLLLGKATKLQDQFMGQDKIYSGTIHLGVETDSEDRTGQITAEADIASITAAAVTAASQTFLGPQMQVPPMVSALKVKGQPLYKLARQGKSIPREPRPISIHSFILTAFRLPEVDFVAHCSKGTYIRTLAADLGQRLGCGAHLQELRRLASGDFRIEDAHSMAELKSWELPELQNNVRVTD